MATDQETFAKSYSQMIDDELLNLHSEGIITEIAYDVLELELQKRGHDIPQRPPSKKEQLRIAAEMLAQHYAKKTDEELLHLIQFPGTITQEAAVAVALEIQSRGLKIPETWVGRLQVLRLHCIFI